MYPPTVRKGQNHHKQGLTSLDTTNFSYKTKSVSTPDNLIEAARTTPIQTGEHDKPHRAITLALVKVTTLDIRQLWTTFFVCKLAQSLKG